MGTEQRVNAVLSIVVSKSRMADLDRLAEMAGTNRSNLGRQLLEAGLRAELHRIFNPVEREAAPVARE